MVVLKHSVAPFRTVLLDPPWNEQGGGKCKRGADRYYPLMKKHDILATVLTCPLWNQMDTDFHMYLWVTNNFLKEGLWLMEALNVRYITNFVWTKGGAMGLGQYFRGQHELCLFGAKGKRSTAPRTDRRDIGSHIDVPRGTHSSKPERSYELIEARSKGPYLELFARTYRPGWIGWGNQLLPE